MREGRSDAVLSSSVLVSQRNRDNTVSSHACLGTANLGRVGVVVRAASQIDRVSRPAKKDDEPKYHLGCVRYIRMLVRIASVDLEHNKFSV